MSAAAVPAVVEASPSLLAAGFGRRAGAKLIDYALFWVLGLIAAVITGFVLAVLAKLGIAPHDWARRLGKIGMLHSLAYGLTGATLYGVVCEAICGTTVGKWMLGLRVVTPEAGRVGFIAALIRNLA